MPKYEAGAGVRFFASAALASFYALLLLYLLVVLISLTRAFAAHFSQTSVSVEQYTIV